MIKEMSQMDEIGTNAQPVQAIMFHSFHTYTTKAAHRETRQTTFEIVTEFKVRQVGCQGEVTLSI